MPPLAGDLALDESLLTRSRILLAQTAAILPIREHSFVPTGAFSVSMESKRSSGLLI
jgi:hypothetical protein